MTWVAALRSWNYAIALFDTQVTSVRGPVTDFGIMKLQGVAVNAVAGFAGSVAIGLDIIQTMSQAATAKEKRLPAGTRFAVQLPFYAMDFIAWLKPQYSDRYSETAREQGLELLMLASLPVADPAVRGDILADLTQGVKIVFPRPRAEQEFEISLLNLVTPTSIGSGARLKEYAKALEKTHDRFAEFQRKLTDPDQYTRFAEFAAGRARAITPLLEAVLREHPAETVGQQLLCSVVTPEGLFGPYFLGGWAKERPILHGAAEVRTSLRGDQQAAGTLRA